MNGSGDWSRLHAGNSPDGWLEKQRQLEGLEFPPTMEVLEGGVSLWVAAHSPIGPFCIVSSSVSEVHQGCWRIGGLFSFLEEIEKI